MHDNFKYRASWIIPLLGTMLAGCGETEYAKEDLISFCNDTPGYQWNVARNICEKQSSASSCVKDVCKDATTLKKCESDGTTYDFPCANGCMNDACMLEKCVADQCFDKQILIKCAQDGSVSAQTCAHGCVNDACVPEPDDNKNCRDTDRPKCDDDNYILTCQGGHWQKSNAPCPNGCKDGVCARSSVCGNGMVEPGESCDGTRLNDQTCASIVGTGSKGVLLCRLNCMGFDTSWCSAPNSCGNQRIDDSELCDGGDLGGATCESVVGPGSTGSLGCQANCSDFDVSACSTPTTCNNGNLDEGEVCDGDLLGDATCESVVGIGSTGKIACADNCYDFDRKGCTAASVCGNGILQKGEECDGDNFNGETCESLVGSGSRGSLICSNCVISTENCSAASTCGDKDHVIDKGEKCDGPNLNNATCASVVGEGSEGTLACRVNCLDFDISGCTAAAKCGNGIVEEGEVCDGMRLNDRTCATEVGFGSTGTLKCNDKCTGFITSGCSAPTTCGNGKLETGEVCDGTNIRGATCASLVGPGSVGTVLCGADCKNYNLSGCSAANTCGDGVLSEDEWCDGNSFLSSLNTCEKVDSRFGGGTLKCVNCEIDTSGCTSKCGNGVLDDGEWCDGSNFDPMADTCGKWFSGATGTLSCKSNCEVDTSNCTNPGSSPTLEVNWCSFNWLTMDASHNAYSRIFLPSGKSPDSVLAYMACTNDLSKPVTQWDRVSADHNASCFDCGGNTEFKTVEPYAGVGGTNYCTFIFDFAMPNDTDIYACLPNGGVPIHIVKDQTKLSADQTRNFQGESYDNLVTMNGWVSSNNASYSTNHSEQMPDGSRINVTAAFYVTDHIIDGVTAVLNAKKDSQTKIVISNLSMGVGIVSFKYKSYGASGDALSLNITDGTTTKTLDIKNSDTSVQPATFTFDNKTAKTVTIAPELKTSTTASRVLIDDIRWTSAP